MTEKFERRNTKKSLHYGSFDSECVRQLLTRGLAPGKCLRTKKGLGRGLPFSTIRGPEHRGQIPRFLLVADEPTPLWANWFSFRTAGGEPSTVGWAGRRAISRTNILKQSNPARFEVPARVFRLGNQFPNVWFFGNRRSAKSMKGRCSCVQGEKKQRVLLQVMNYVGTFDGQEGRA